MNDKTTISISGLVTPFVRRDGKDIPLEPVHNTVQEGAKGVIAQALAFGRGIGKVYFLFSTSSSPSSVGASGGNLTVLDFTTAGSASGNGLVSCPAYAVGVDATGEEGPDRATFLAVTAGATAIAGQAFADGMYVYAVGLVQEVDGTDYLYAACDLSSPIAKIANSQVGVRWATTISVR